jgi:outer membrane protein assembly factor BamB
MTPRRVVIAAVALLVLGALGAGAAWWWNERRTSDVRGSSTKEFVTTEQTATRAAEEVETEPWPIYGLTVDRTRNAVDFHHRPPFQRRWVADAGSLMEFPPVIANGSLYFANIRGALFAVDAKNGRRQWRRKFGYVSAASPAVSDGVVYHPLLNQAGTERGPRSGLMVAVDAETGKDVWRFRTGAVESSPLLVNGMLYFGTFDRRVYALDVSSKQVRWTFETGDSVKGGPAYWRGTIYTGSYDGKVYALDARTGKLRWSSEGRAGLTGAGNFYAGPAVAYGRVYIGNTDGKVYAFGARSGDLIWAKSTGDFVYSSAAVADQTVFVGSYDHRLYAFDAATGDEKWSFDAGGAVSGAPTVMEGLVYFSTLRGKTYALDARTGKSEWTFPDGEYTPLVADEERAYIVGRSRVYAMTSRR